MRCNETSRCKKKNRPRWRTEHVIGIYQLGICEKIVRRECSLWKSLRRKVEDCGESKGMRYFHPSNSQNWRQRLVRRWVWPRLSRLVSLSETAGSCPYNGRHPSISELDPTGVFLFFEVAEAWPGPHMSQQLDLTVLQLVKAFEFPASPHTMLRRNFFARVRRGTHQT